MLQNLRKNIRSFLVKINYLISSVYIQYKNSSQGKYYSQATDIPIIINNRNRLTFLKQLIQALEHRGYTNIHIIDNASTYLPLLEYYKECPYPIYRLEENAGFRSLWETGLYKNFIHNYYVYTDSDVVPVENCPDNFLQIMLDRMRRDKRVYKIGLSLKIDDLPGFFDKKEEVIEWEKQFSETVVDSSYYLAKVDTTFALYRPYMKFDPYYIFKTYRGKYPLQAYHMPWYSDSGNLSEEEKYYLLHVKTSTHWSQ